MKIDYEHPATGTVGWFQECIQILESRLKAVEDAVFPSEDPKPPKATKTP
jgi:hypothetical protein